MRADQSTSSKELRNAFLLYSFLEGGHMHLNNYHFQPDYNKAFDNIAEEFYLPCMRTARSYDRISGYFGSTIYIIAWGALKEFVNNGGKMRIICSPYLSDEDQEAIKVGYSSKIDEILLRSIEKEIDEMFASDFLSVPSRALACLIALVVHPHRK